MLFRSLSFTLLVFMSNNQLVGMLLLGISVGSFIPRTLPVPGDVINPLMPFAGFVFLAAAIIMFVKG